MTLLVATLTFLVMEPVTFFARGERNIGGILPLIVLTNWVFNYFTYERGVRLITRPDC